jgi:hypothetical protein
MRIRIGIVVVLLLTLASSSRADEFIRTHSLPPLHVDRDEFLAAINEVYNYIQAVNRPKETKGTIELGRNEYKTTVSLPVAKEEYRKFPNVAHEAVVGIESYGGPVSKTSLMLFDGIRNVEVKGSSQDHVAGVVNVVEEKLNVHATAVGGLRFRFYLGGVFIVAVTLLITINWLGLGFKNQAIVYVAGLILMQATLWFPDWETLFPGFLATSHNRSLLEEYSPHFTFLGLLVAIVTPLVGLVLRKVRANKGVNPTG